MRDAEIHLLHASPVSGPENEAALYRFLRLFSANRNDFRWCRVGIRRAEAPIIMKTLYITVLSLLVTFAVGCAAPNAPAPQSPNTVSRAELAEVGHARA